jgi:4-carboxymuconolactone decarboxylase
MTESISVPTLQDLEAVAPALRHFTEQAVNGALWQRTELSARDRSIVTLALVIARNQAVQITPALDTALSNGVKAAEISEVITHLAFYAGWGNAMAAVLPAKAAFERNGVDLSELPPAQDASLPLDEEGESKRATAVASNFGEVAPGVVQNTTDYLFRDLWLRPALAPRDRSLVTVTALVGAGQVAQIPYHLNRAMDNGLTQAQAAEVLTQLAFHAGWPNVFSAMPVFKDVFASRS